MTPEAATTTIAICMVILTLAILVGVGAILVMLSRETEVANVHAQLAEMGRQLTRVRSDEVALHDLLEPLYAQFDKPGFDVWSGGDHLGETLRRMKLIVPCMREEAARSDVETMYANKLLSFGTPDALRRLGVESGHDLARHTLFELANAASARAEVHAMRERKKARDAMFETVNQAADLVGVPRMDLDA